MFTKGAASGSWVFGWGEVNLTEFKNVKQVGKNTYSLFKFFNCQKCKACWMCEQRMIITCKVCEQNSAKQW